MDLHTIQKLVLINLEPVLSYLHEAKVSEFCETSHGYLTSDVAKFVYMLLSIVSTYGTVSDMKFRFYLSFSWPQT